MAAFDYGESQDDAEELIAEFGQAVTITRSTAGAYNTASGTAALTPTTENGTGAEVAFTEQAIAGTLVQGGDKKLLVSPLKTDGTALTKPQADTDTVTLLDGSVWTVKAVDTLAPAGVNVLFTLLLRKG